jgi:hypothetical protein
MGQHPLLVLSLRIGDEPVQRPERWKHPRDQGGRFEGIRAVLFRNNYHYYLDRRERLGPDREERIELNVYRKK